MDNYDYNNKVFANKNNPFQFSVKITDRRDFCSIFNGMKKWKG